MIECLTQRSQFWTEHHIAKCQGNSIARPFEAIPDYPDVLIDRTILEIGPGEGRQARVASRLGAVYAIADISPGVLGRAQYAGFGRFLITDYASDDFDARFDVVCFWYVLHHVLLDEADAFFGFVKRHMKPGGSAIFNAPHANPASQIAAGNGNGLQTTPWTIPHVLELVERHGLSVRFSADLAPNCFLVHAVRHDDQA